MSPSARVRVVPPIAPYTASIDDALVIAAALAGAGAVISKSSAAAAVLEAIRELARSPRSLPQIPAPLGREMAARLEPVDQQILAMRLAGDHPRSRARSSSRRRRSALGSKT